MRLTVICVVILSVTLLIGCTQSARISTLALPDETITSRAPIDVASYAAKYAKYDGVILSVNQTIEHSGVKDDVGSMGLFGAMVKGWVYSRIYTEKYLILNPHAQRLSTYSFSHLPDKLYMLTVSPSGQITRFVKENLQVVKDDEGVERYKIAFPRVEKGTVVEIGYEDSYTVSRYPPPLDYDIPLQFYLPCESLSFTFAYPSWWTIKVKRLDAVRSVPVTVEPNADAKKMVMVYRANNVPALRVEPYSPPFKQMAMYLQFMVTHFQMMGIKWDARSTWDKMAEDFCKYEIKKVDKQSTTLKHLVDSLIAGAPDNYAKLDRIVSWVSRNIEPSYKSYNADPDKTLSNRKGNVYDISGLAQAMLNLADIPSDFILVHDADDGWFDPEYVSSEQLYKPALSVTIDKKSYLTLPWIKKLPVSIVPEDYRGEASIKVGKEYAGALGPAIGDDQEPEVAEQTMDITVDTAGIVRVMDVRTSHDELAYQSRLALEGLDKAKRAEMVDSAIGFKDAEVSVDSFTFENDTSYSQPLISRYYFTVHNLTARTPDEIILQTTELLAPAFENVLVDSADRQNPIWLRYPATYRSQVTLHWPSEWALTTPLQNNVFENEFGAVSCSYEQTPQQLVVTQSVSLKKCQMPKEKIGDLASLIGTSSKTSVPALVFKASANPAQKP